MPEAAPNIGSGTEAVFSGLPSMDTKERSGEQLTLIEVRKKDPVKRRVAVRDIILRGPAPDVTWLRDSIERVGVLHDPILIEVGGGRYEVLAGRRRIWAIRSLGLETVDAKVYEEGDISDVESLGILLTENAARTDNPIIELRAIEALLRSEFTVKGISKSLGKPQGWVRTRLALRHLCPQLRKALETGKLTLAAALKAAKLATEEQILLAEKSEGTGAGRISLDAVEAMKKREPAPVPLRMFATDPAKANEPLERLRKMKDEIGELIKDLARSGRAEAAERAREAYEGLGRLRTALERKEGKD